MKAHATKGQVLAPTLLYGFVGWSLAVTINFLGFFERGNLALQAFLGEWATLETPFDQVSEPILMLITAVLCTGLAMAVLDSRSVWRRMILCVSTLMVVLSAVPTLAVWNIYFSPFLMFVAVFWTSFCTVMYSYHHLMPCDGAALADQISPDSTTHGQS
ncbi:MAG: hypothetical protein ACSHX0_02345 [Akkermansiaceae bacterium]